jgi:hypothetical protein
MLRLITYRQNTKLGNEDFPSWESCLVNMKTFDYQIVSNSTDNLTKVEKGDSREAILVSKG